LQTTKGKTPSPKHKKCETTENIQMKNYKNIKNLKTKKTQCFEISNHQKWFEITNKRLYLKHKIIWTCSHKNSFATKLIVKLKLIYLIKIKSN
jgi:hypothetical protein